MAGSSLIALIDDIATVLDDIAMLTKVASKKTAGVLGDDLALNAQQVAGVRAERELPVVWAVAKGSAKNKLILVPLALAISWFAPWGVVPLLMFGGAFLCYEGVEKLAHKWLHGAEESAHEQDLREAIEDPSIDLVALEKEKIKGAIRTDFVLSAEIVTIALGTVADRAIGSRIAVLTLISALMTVGVYGLVAGLVKLDDLGLKLVRRRGTRWLGRALLVGTPVLMKLLSVGGTIAMFLVGGGILVHGVHVVQVWIDAQAAKTGSIGATVLPSVASIVIGVVVGALILSLVEGAKKLMRPKR